MAEKHLECAKTLRADTAVHRNCAQSVILPFAKECGLTFDQGMNLGKFFGSGMKMGGCCGAITGGLMVLGLLGADDEQYQAFMKKMRENHDGLVDCRDLLKRNQELGGLKKPHCDNMVYEAIENILEVMNMTPHFYGADASDAVTADNPDYPGIHTPKDLYTALIDCWCKETCADRMRDEWSKDNPTLGQCTITAFLAQDIFGGKVYGILRPHGNYHCYNVVGDTVFDLTSEQFGEEAKTLVYENNSEQSREEHFAKDDKKERYELLKDRLMQKLSEKKEEAGH